MRKLMSIFVLFASLGASARFVSPDTDLIPRVSSSVILQFHSIGAGIDDEALRAAHEAIGQELKNSYIIFFEQRGLGGWEGDTLICVEGIDEDTHARIISAVHSVEPKQHKPSPQITMSSESCARHATHDSL